jgi:hypothetical protein
LRRAGGKAYREQHDYNNPAQYYYSKMMPETQDAGS